MDVTLIMKRIHKLQNEIEILENKQKEIKSQLEDNNNELKVLKTTLMENMIESDELEYEDLVAKKFQREIIGYSDENEILRLLKEKYEGKFIKTKITESLDKVPLKKAIKYSADLSEDIEPFITKTSNPYVVVTTKDKYEKMMNCINNE